MSSISHMLLFESCLFFSTLDWIQYLMKRVRVNENFMPLIFSRMYHVCDCDFQGNLFAAYGVIF